MKFSSNPLDGVHVGSTGKKKNNAILDSQGNVLLNRQGREWSENDQLPYDLLMKGMDYRYQAELLNYQNEYNSPEQQALRMRQAGINPDLVGTSNNPSASSNASAPNTQLNEGAETARKMQYAQQFIELIPQAVKLYTDMKSFEQSNQLSDLQIAQGVQALGDNEVMKQFTLEDLQSAVSMPQANLSHIKNKKLRSKVDDYIFSLVSDASNRDYAKGLVYDKKKRAESNRQGFLGLLSSFGFDVEDDIFVSVLREFNDVLYGSQQAKNKYDKDYYSNVSGSDDAKLHKTETSKKTTVAENDVMADLFKKASDKLDSKEPKEQITGAIMYLVLSLMRSKAGVQ